MNPEYFHFLSLLQSRLTAGDTVMVALKYLRHFGHKSFREDLQLMMSDYNIGVPFPEAIDSFIKKYPDLNKLCLSDLLKKSFEEEVVWGSSFDSANSVGTLLRSPMDRHNSGYLDLIADVPQKIFAGSELNDMKEFFDQCQENEICFIAKDNKFPPSFPLAVMPFPHDAHHLKDLLPAILVKTDEGRVVKLQEILGYQRGHLVLQDLFTYVLTGIDKERLIIGHYEASGILPRFIEKVEKRGNLFSRHFFFVSRVILA